MLKIKPKKNIFVSYLLLNINVKILKINLKYFKFVKIIYCLNVLNV